MGGKKQKAKDEESAESRKTKRNQINIAYIVAVHATRENKTKQKSKNELARAAQKVKRTGKVDYNGVL